MAQVRESSSSDSRVPLCLSRVSMQLDTLAACLVPAFVELEVSGVVGMAASARCGAARDLGCESQPVH